ncbi:MAG: hypothetical protein JWN78_388, partial [Bacteroidota bacterium]|nr:hypothetical protein [Bacteroidota bacterium]
STITLNLIVRPTTSQTIDSSICQGDSVTVGGQTFNTTGTHVVVIPNSQSCDSTITLNLIVRSTTLSTIDSSICSGDSVTVGGQTFNTTGTHVVVIPNSQSCDSTITLNLIVRSTSSSTIDSSICSGGSVTVGGQTFNTTGTHVVVIPNSQSCDSTITLNLIVRSTSSFTIDSSICQGASVTVGGQTFNTTGMHVVVIPNAQSCDSTITLNLIVRPTTSQTIDSSICQGDSVTVGGQTFNTTGMHVVVIPNAQSCDSTITLNLIVRPTTSQVIDSSICQGASVTVGGQTFNSTGTHVVVIPNSQSCDSTITLNLIVRSTTSQTIDSSICQGDIVTIGGQTFNTAGTHVAVIPNSQGCDSIITLNLSVRNCLVTDTLREIRVVQTTQTICNIPKPLGTPIVVTACDGSTAGTTTLGGIWIIVDSCLVYIAGPNKGIDTLCINACDIQPMPRCIQTIVIITVVGLPPLAVNDTSGTDPNIPVTIDVMHNDTTFDNDPLGLCSPQGIIIQPSHGSAVVNGDGTITYTPLSGYSGLDSFQYQLCDIDGSDSAWVFITISGCEIPNAFSPNGDGINDQFKIPCAHSGAVFFDVFNRWGIEVYKNENYISDWDGKYEGAQLPDGTYYYILKYVSDDGTVIDKAGFITLHR